MTDDRWRLVMSQQSHMAETNVTRHAARPSYDSQTPRVGCQAGLATMPPEAAS